MAKIIDQISLPEGLRTLTTEELQLVATELREGLIESVACTGGHFASSLGATEITVALHHAFDTPHDKIVWDVGHQAYIHKMITGRRDTLHTIRKKDGISGFLKRNESPYDVFGAGHAGTSISAAVGLRVALDRTNPERYVISVIGDGSLTCGMAFEAMNHAGDLGLRNFIVILNDNEMSISPNVGAISWLFSKAITSKTSNFARKRFKDLYKRGYIPEVVYKFIDRAEEATQSFFASPAMLFEAFGFRYIGPVDGHNIVELKQALEHAKEQDIPVLIHAHTVKGKGYEPAEIDPIKWHGVTPFDKDKGEFVASKPVAAQKIPPSYTAVFAETFIELAEKDPKVVAITAAMLGGTGLDKAASKVPDSVFDVGICEQHAVTFAAGLACQGYHPICAIYSTFLQRAYDQVLHDVCIQNLPVVFAMDRSGVVGNDGETHQGVFDIAYLKSIPNIVIMSPKDENELRQMLFTALKLERPVAIRYPRGNGEGVKMESEFKELALGKAEILKSGKEVLILGLGPMVNTALRAAEKLSERYGISCTVVNARFAKPLDQELLRAELPKYDLVCTLEDHALNGGFGAAVLEYASDHGIQLKAPIVRFGVQDSFVPHASQSEQQAQHGYDLESIVSAVAGYFKGLGLQAVG